MDITIIFLIACAIIYGLGKIKNPVDDGVDNWYKEK